LTGGFLFCYTNYTSSFNQGESMTIVPKGKFIVLYGINNIGKSTQVKLLYESIKASGRFCVSIKYAQYDVNPSGPLLNDYLRKQNPLGLTAREFQILHALNRTQCQERLETFLSQGVHVVCEDYIGTSLTWGIAAGVDKDFLINLNNHLTQPDLAILLDGNRFLASTETGHKHETDSELTARVRLEHLYLAREYGWPIIDANQTIAQVAKDIWDHASALL